MTARDVPLYMVIYKDLQAKIANQTYKVGCTLPSELELQKQYKVSRITIRRALSDLEHDGIISRTRGKGTIVLAPKKYTDLYLLTGFNEDARKHGDVPSSIILNCEEQPASVAVAEALNIEPGEMTYFLRRLRLINGKISGIFETNISERFNFTIDVTDLDSSMSLYDFYESNGVEVCDATETIEAIMPNSQLKNELFLTKEEPIFFRKRITYDQNHKPIELSNNFYKANGYKYIVHLHRDHLLKERKK